MQIPTQPPQILVDEAKRNVRNRLAIDPGYRVTPHGLVDDRIVERYEAPGGYPLDVSIAAIDELVAENVLEEIGLHAFVMKQPAQCR